MTALAWIGFAVGIVIVLATTLSVVQNLLLTERQGSFLTFALLRINRATFGALSRRAPRQPVRDRLLAAIGPLVVLENLVIWLGLYFIGYGLILWPLVEVDGAPSFGSALRASGSSLFTLGFSAPADAAPIALVFVIAATGIIVIALKIAYLPVLYGQFAIREAGVASFASRSGVPPWGPEVLAYHFEHDLADSLPDLFGEWCGRVSEMSVAHAHYPTLVFFRASIPNTSWITSLVAMLDAANLYVSCAPARAPNQCRLLMLVAQAGMERLTDPLRFEVPPRDPGLSREDFAAGMRRLRHARVPIENDEDAAWADFSRRRAGYAPTALVLRRLTLAPRAPW